MLAAVQWFVDGAVFGALVMALMFLRRVRRYAREVARMAALLSGGERVGGADER